MKEFDMLKLITGLAISLAIIGCGATNPTKPNIVEVPIQVKCKPTSVIDEQPKSKVTTDAKALALSDKTKLLVAELETTKARNIQLEIALAECTK